MNPKHEARLRAITEKIVAHDLFAPDLPRDQRNQAAYDLAWEIDDRVGYDADQE